MPTDQKNKSCAYYSDVRSHLLPLHIDLKGHNLIVKSDFTQCLIYVVYGREGNISAWIRFGLGSELDSIKVRKDIRRGGVSEI